VVAFARSDGNAAVLAVASRHHTRLVGQHDPLTLPIGDLWNDTRLSLPPALAGRRWRDALTDRTLGGDGGALPLAAVLADLPVALLEAV
jgi:(1->4)-alpha-D-glucan 1-alpha-D-glucosylmutase